MNELDNDQFARNLLGRLAATMPDNPGRAAAVQRGVRRRHRRRVATRASVGLTFAAGVGLVTVEARRSQPLHIAAASSTDTKSSDTVAGKVPVEGDDPCANDGATRSVRPSDEGRLKIAGTITAVNGDTISVSVEESQVPMTDFTATIAADATYVDAGQPSTTRPTMGIGDRVAFGAVEQPDGSYTIDTLEAHAPDAAHSVAKQSSAESQASIDEAKRQHAIAVCAGTAG